MTGISSEEENEFVNTETRILNNGEHYRALRMSGTQNVRYLADYNFLKMMGKGSYLIFKP